MFNSKDTVITRVFNPLNITKGSMIEFYEGELEKRIQDFTVSVLLSSALYRE